MNSLKKYSILWISQSISQLGSAMTAYALVLWAYTQTHSAFSISLMSFCEYLPYIFVSIFVGSFIDNHSKKAIMLISDSISALMSLMIFCFQMTGTFSIWHIYVVNIVVGITTAFQQPASLIAIERIVPENKLSTVSGMNSLTENAVLLLSPVFATALFTAGGLWSILLFDLISFAVAFVVLFLFIQIPEYPEKHEETSSYAGIKTGVRFLRKEKGILYTIFMMSLINFISRITYQNILSPMILARSSDNTVVLGIVNVCMGVGGVLGGLFITFGKEYKKVNMIYLSTALSFLLGDCIMAIGNNVYFWSFAAFAVSFPIPFIVAGQTVILYKKVPKDIQGRVFAVRNAIQYGTIPLGIILGGYLADYVFEPLIHSTNKFVAVLQNIVGSNAGSGMALMFLCTGILGFSVSVTSLFNKEIQKLND